MGFTQFLQQQFANSPILRNLSPRIQLFLGGSIFALLVILIIMTVSNVMSLRGPLVLSQELSTPAVGRITQSKILNYFHASDLDIVYVDTVRDQSIRKDVIRLEILDVDNQSRNIQIFVYDSVQAIFTDTSFLTQYEQTSNVLTFANIIVVYPLDMSEVSASAITEVYQTIKGL